MFKLECKFNAKSLEKALMEAAANAVVERVRRIRCPEHGEYAKVVATGRSTKDLRFNVSGCCEKLIDQVTSQLGAK